MNTKLVTLLCAGLMVSSAFAANQSVYITGATAFRGNVKTALLNQGFTCVQKDNTNIDKANKRTWTGTIGSDNVTVYESFSGSVEGIQALAGTQNVTYMNAADGTSFSHVAQLSFSDVWKEASLAYTAIGISEDKVGVVPFAFARSLTTTNAIVGVRHNQLKLAFANGYLPLDFLIGGTNVGTPVYFLGRNNMSGTRATVHADTDYGVFTAAQLAYAVPNTTSPTSFAISWSPGGNPDSGYSSGSSVTAALQNAPSSLPCIGYSAVDALVAAGLYPSPNCTLSYNGVPFSPDNVKNGTYSLWAYEHLFYITGASDYATATFRPQLISWIGNTLDGVIGIKLSDMKCARDVDGGPIYPTW